MYPQLDEEGNGVYEESGLSRYSVSVQDSLSIIPLLGIDGISVLVIIKLVSSSELIPGEYSCWFISDTIVVCSGVTQLEVVLVLLRSVPLLLSITLLLVDEVGAVRKDGSMGSYW